MGSGATTHYSGGCENIDRIRIRVGYGSHSKKNLTCAVHIAMKRSDTGRITAKKSELGHFRLQCERTQRLASKITDSLPTFK